MNFPTIPATQMLTLLEPPSGPVDIVLDTDTFNEIDDQFSVVYSMLSPSINVQAIYAAPFHNEKSSGPADGMEKSLEEIQRVLSRLGHDSSFALPGSKSWLPSREEPVESEAARDLVRRALEPREGGKPLYVVGIGAITNVASAILMAPEIIERIVVVWLGGHPWHWKDTDEFNLQGDINASRLLFDCGVPVVQVPCASVAEMLRVSLHDMEALARPHGAIGEYLYEIFAEATHAHPVKTRVIWDIAPIAWLNNSQWAHTSLRPSPIVSTEKNWSFNPHRHFGREVLWLNRDAIFEDFFAKLHAR